MNNAVSKISPPEDMKSRNIQSPSKSLKESGNVDKLRMSREDAIEEKKTQKV